MFQAHPERQLTKITLLVVSSLTVMASATIAPALPAMHAAFSDLPNVDLLVRLVLTIPGLFIVLGAPAAGCHRRQLRPQTSAGGLDVLVRDHR